MAKTVFDVLTEEIDAAVAVAKEHLAKGKVKDYPEYREVCGLIRGLESTRTAVQDLSRNYMEDDDD